MIIFHALVYYFQVRRKNKITPLQKRNLQKRNVKNLVKKDVLVLKRRNKFNILLEALLILKVQKNIT